MNSDCYQLYGFDMLQKNLDYKIASEWGNKYMKKIISLLISLLFVLQMLFCSSALADIPVFSTDALVQYCKYWNDYFEENDPILFCDYALSDDKKNISGIYILYNPEQKEVGFGIDAIPATSDLLFSYNMSFDIYSFNVFSVEKKEDLEKVVIYLDDDVINNVYVNNDRSDQDMWQISLGFEEVQKIFLSDSFTIRMTIGGKNEIVDISQQGTPHIYRMVQWLIGAQIYSNTRGEDYRNLKYLPDGDKVIDTPSPVPTREVTYSFQQDYVGIEKAVKSLFYVEKIDSNNTSISSASGFVSFDEHLFVTNQHVINNGSYLKIWDEDNNVYLLDKVIASDKEHDIAILLFPEGYKYDALEQDAEGGLMRGQPVTTIGSPEGYQNTVAFGNISAFPILDGIRYIQFTAPISHGSSGGCLFNDAGKVIGITSAGVDEGQNINFAIPIKFVQELYDQWDKNSYEQLGSERSWDMVSITPTPTPEPTPTPAPLTEVSINNQLRLGYYSGELKNGVPNGQGSFESMDTLPVLSYKGEWTDGKACGKGSLNDSAFTIHFEELDGTVYDRTGTFVGDTINAIPSGQGSFTTKNSEGITWTYIGEFANGTFNGLGEQKWEESYSPLKGFFTNGNYTPSWSQFMESVSIADNCTIYGKSLELMDQYESVFTSQTEIDPDFIYVSWKASDLKINPSLYSRRLVHKKNLKVVQIDEYTGYGRPLFFAILEDGSGHVFYGYFGSETKLEVDATVADIYLLPLNWITYKNVNNEDVEAVYCAFARLGNKELKLTPTPSPTPTPEPPKVDTLSTGVFINQYGIINHAVNFRDEPSSDSFNAGPSLKIGEYVYIIENVANSLDEVWSKVNVNGTVGYIKSEYIYALSKQESDYYDKLQSTPAPIYTPTPTPSPTPIPTPTPTATPQTVNYGQEASYRIELSEYELTVYKGAPVAISPKVVSLENDKAKTGIKTTWESSDPAVAEVKNSKIFGNSVGDAVLSCRLQNDESVYTLVFVHVKEPVKKISLDVKSVELVCNRNGNRYAIHPNIEPKDASYDQIIYSSSNKKVADVDENGLVTAVGPGTTMITISLKMKGVATIPKYTLSVKVVKVVDDITNLNSEYELAVNKTLVLSPKVEPADATNKKLIWESSDESIATVSANGTVKAIKAGQCTIKATASDGNGVYKTCVIRVIQPVTAIKSLYKGSSSWRQEVNKQIGVSGLFSVEPDNASNKELMIEIYKGQEKVYGAYYYKITGDSYATQKLFFYTPGLYTIKAKSTDGSNKTASTKIRIYPSDMMTLDVGYIHWDYPGYDQLSVWFDVSNADYGVSVSAFELYVYATDIWGNRIYGENKVYYATTEKRLDPGQKVSSVKITLPNLSKISRVYVGVHKIKFNDSSRTVKTYDDVNYVYVDIK